MSARSAMVLAALLAVGFASVLDAPAQGPEAAAKLRREFSVSFKGKPEMLPEAKLVGPLADEDVAFEPDGLRIHLLAGYAKERAPTGVATGIHIKGDCEVTVHFEVLRAPPPENSGPNGTRFGLMVGLGPQVKNVARVTWAMRPEGGPLFVAWTNASLDGAKPRSVATNARAGRLRLVRTGSTLSYYAAENDSDEFIPLLEHPATTEDLSDVSIVGQTHNREAELDVRFTDLRIRVASPESLPNLSTTTVAATDATASTPTPGDRGQTGWGAVVWLPVLAVVLSLGAGLGLWIYRAQRQRAGSSAKAAETTAGVVSFKCSCGKSLKARAELAGKKVKCSQCGQAALVPAMQL